MGCWIPNCVLLLRLYCSYYWDIFVHGKQVSHWLLQWGLSSYRLTPSWLNCNKKPGLVFLLLCIDSKIFFQATFLFRKSRGRTLVYSLPYIQNFSTFWIRTFFSNCSIIRYFSIVLFLYFLISIRTSTHFQKKKIIVEKSYDPPGIIRL